VPLPIMSVRICWWCNFTRWRWQLTRPDLRVLLLHRIEAVLCLFRLCQFSISSYQKNSKLKS